MDIESLRLKILWSIPLLPKKKAKQFLQFGDCYRVKGREDLAQFCYHRALSLATSVRAVSLQRKIAKRVETPLSGEKELLCNADTPLYKEKRIKLQISVENPA